MQRVIAECGTAVLKQDPNDTNDPSDSCRPVRLGKREETGRICIAGPDEEDRRDATMSTHATA